MKQWICVAAMMLLFMSGAGLRAQTNPVYTTICIEYVGEMDRPILPVILSNSSGEAEQYKQKYIQRYKQEWRTDSDTFSFLIQLIDIYIVPESTMKKISDMLLQKGDLKQPDISGRPITAPTLELILATGQDSRRATVKAEQSVIVLDELKKLVPEQQPLVNDLSYIERYMNRFLKRLH